MAAREDYLLDTAGQLHIGTYSCSDIVQKTCASPGQTKSQQEEERAGHEFPPQLEELFV